MGDLKRYVLVMGAGWLFAGLPSTLGCAGGGSDGASNGILLTDSAPPDDGPDDAATDGDSATSTDATTADATEDDAGDAAVSAEDASALDSAAGDASEANDASDAGPDVAVRFDAAIPDAEPSDAAIDGAPDAADAALPTCPTSGTCGPQALCISGFCTPSRRVFVSTQMFTGNLGGTSGADSTCQSTANGAQLGGSWKAWVSDSSTSPSTRFAHASVGYRLVDGTLLANDWTGLVSGALLHAIDLTEHGASATGSEVWTGTLESGVAIGTNVCSGFTSSANGATHAVIGNTSRTDIGWSNATSQSCDQNNLRIYCMEQ
jgi:hypothetical protein